MQQTLFNQPDNLLPFNGEVLYMENFFTHAESDAYYKHLVENIAWKQEPITIFGKQVLQPRLTAWYGDANKPYSYSGITMQPHVWTADLLHIKQRIETIAGVHFTSALLNCYRHGQDSMGWHRDNEKELGINPVIGSVSLGAARKFQLRNYANKSIVKTLDLTHGSFLLMRGETQHYWEHRIPKTKQPTGARINITFRVIV
jgi:alkylated DNA repair dioxygenase AlkB